MSSHVVALRPADNPFASHRVECLAYRSAGAGVAELARRVPELGGRVAIVGPEGSGKTTLLHELANYLPGEPVPVAIPAGASRPWHSARSQLPRPVRPRHVILLDGTEQLGPLDWRRLLWAARSARTLAATLHGPGRLPTLVECRTDPGLLHELVSELIPAGPPLADLDGVFSRHQGNIRLCLRELYDLYAGRL